jgi:hypothetical protein
VLQLRLPTKPACLHDVLRRGVDAARSKGRVVLFRADGALADAQRSLF